uniref:Portal protein n=1 Tax=viral metagenome TaxID=1070528 RepID=A0A6M3K7P6_9ZZZZ
MPNIIRGNEAFGNTSTFVGKEFEYDYPFELNLDPKGDLHRDIVNRIMKYAQEAAGNISNRYESWNEIDRTLTAYIELDDKEEEVIYNDYRKPVSIVFPNTYAIMETIQAYLVAAFYQDPIFRYEGVGPEDVIGSILMEKVIDLHCNKTKVGLDLHTMFRDSLAYGIGMVSPTWKKDDGWRTVVREQTGLLGLFNQKVKGVEKATLFEGNALENIDPYLALPDPNVSIHKVQDGEFFGWVERTNYSNLLSNEKNDSDYFNVKYVDSVHNKGTSIYGYDKSDRDKKWTGGRQKRYHTEPGAGYGIKGGMATKPCDVVHMYIKLIPKEWKIGTAEYPEKWLFSVAADSVIVRAKPLDLDHNKFPVAIAAPDFDGYSAIPVSRLEMLNGLQRVLDWMFNMHIANVRKTINDVLIYDPYLINSKDINSPEAGKRIRIRRPGWGRPDIAKGAVHQLQIADVTRQHIPDSSWIVQWQQKIGGADDVAMGALRQGGPERLSKAEFQGTQQGQFSRLGRIARVIGLQAMQDIGEMFAAHTQQLMTEEQYVKITGRWQEVLMKEQGISNIKKNRGRISVSPFDILVQYDLKVRDGSVPGGNYSDVWMRMFEVIAKIPELNEKFDIARIFAHIARNNGAKDVNSFIRTRVISDEEASVGEEKGNLVPFDQAAAGGLV